jgi:hypothetical protein
MTLPHESANSVNKAREFLFDLLDPKKTPNVPKNIRDRASAILKHYPYECDVKTMHDPGCSVTGWGKGKDE